MMAIAPPLPILLLGPTAGGKSDLAVGLAEKLQGEVIGADSMQVYRHMDAGTAKPPKTLRDRVPHHLIDIVEPTERFTVHDWLARVNPLIHDIQTAGRRPIVVGGTNLYMQALLFGLFEGPGQDQDFRDSLEPLEPHELHERLQTLDPEAAARIDRNDRKRLVRALEVHHLTGEPISALQEQWTSDRRPFQLVGLTWPVDAINARINLRVKAMFYPDKVEPQLAAEICPTGETLPQETARLEAAGLLGTQAREALGYKQVLAAMAGEMTDEESFERTKILTRRFAKQQRTWLRRFTEVAWINAAELTPDQRLEAAIAATR